MPKLTRAEKIAKLKKAIAKRRKLKVPSFFEKRERIRKRQEKTASKT